MVDTDGPRELDEAAEGVRRLVESRNKQYADAWRKTGELASPIANEIASLHIAFPQSMIPWWTIFCKLIRVLGDPKHLDSWRDMAGYATLVVDYLEKEKSNEVPTGRS